MVYGKNINYVFDSHGYLHFYTYITVYRYAIPVECPQKFWQT